MSASPSSVLLGYGQLVVEVRSSDPTSLQWLAEFMAPAFEQVPVQSGPPIARRLDFDVAPRGYSDLQRLHKAATLDGLEGFSFDGSFSLHRARRDEAGWTWIRDEKRGVFFGVSGDGRHTRVVTARPTAGARVSLMRVVRELGTVAMYEAGHLAVHGAAFVHEGGAVIVCGPKRAGKTSLLVHALSQGSAFVSNDRLFVDLDDPTQVRGMPTIVMLRNGTLERFDTLRRRFEAARFDRARTLSECAPGVEREKPIASEGFDRQGISPAQLCALLDAPMVGTAPARALLLPTIDATAHGIDIQRMEPQRAEAALARCLLKPSDPVRYSQVFGGGAGRVAVTAAEEQAQCRQLVAQVPAFRCRLGPDAYGQGLTQALRQARAV